MVVHGLCSLGIEPTLVSRTPQLRGTLPDVADLTPEVALRQPWR